MTNREIKNNNPEKQNREEWPIDKVREVEQPGKSQLELQLERYHQQQVSLRGFLDKLADLKYKKDIQPQADLEIIEQMDQEDISREQLEATIDELRVEVRESHDKIIKNNEYIQKEIIPMVDKMDFDINHDLDSETQRVEMMISNLRQFDQDIKNFNINIATTRQLEKILAKKIISDHGYNDFDQIKRDINKDTKQLGDLRNGYFNKIKNSRKIKRLREQRQSLIDLYDLQWDTRQSLPDLPFRLANGNNYDVELRKKIIDKIIANFKSDYKNLEQQHEMPSIEINDQLIDYLNDDYIKYYVETEIDREINFLKSRLKQDLYNDSLKKRIEEISNSQNQQKLFSLIKKYFENPAMTGTQDGLPDISNARKKIDDQLEEMPAEFENIAKMNMSNYHDYDIKNDNYHLISKLASQMPRYCQFRNCRQIAEIIDNYFNDNQFLGSRLDVNKIINDIDSHPDYQQIKELFDGKIDIKRWVVFKNNKEVQSHFGKGELSLIDKVFSQNTLNELLDTEKHINQSINLGWKILNFKNADVAPYVIINCIREPGSSGEYPFNRWDTASDNTELHQYLKGFSQDELDKLMRSDIPGLADFVKISKDHPKDYLDEHSADAEEGKSDKNPAYIKSLEALSKICFHFFKKGDPKERAFVSQLLVNLTDLSLSEDALRILDNSLKKGKDIGAVVEILTAHASSGDQRSCDLLISYWPQANEQAKQAIRDKKEVLLGNLSRRQLKNEDQHVLAEIMEISAQDLAVMHPFIYNLYQKGHIASYQKKITNIDKYLELSKHSHELLPFLDKLEECKYSFSIDDADSLLAILKDKDEILEKLEKIKKYFPNFIYRLDSKKYLINQENDQSLEYKITDPYELLATVNESPDMLDFINQADRNGEYGQEISQGIIRALRIKDNLLDDKPNSVFKIPAETYHQFHESLLKLAKNFKKFKNKESFEKNFYSDSNLHNFVARQPERMEEIEEIAEKMPSFLRLMQPGGPLHTNREKVLKNIFSNGNPFIRAREIETIFTKKNPYWKQLYMFTELRLGPTLAASNSSYPITEINNIALDRIIQKHIQAKDKNSSKITRLESIVKHQGLIDKLISGEQNSIPFSSLNGVFKRLVLRNYLKKTVEYSRSTDKKIEADRINRQFSYGDLVLNAGDYIHSSPVEAVNSLLLSGNLPTECLGQEAGKDSYPFHVDLTKLEQLFMEKHQGDTQKIFNDSLSAGSGHRGEHGLAGQVFYLYRKDYCNWEKDKEAQAASSNHVLSLGGLPATEVRGIVLRDAQVSLAKVKKAIVENGFYIPIYDIKGKLIYTSQEHDQIYQDRNLKVPVEVWDYSMKTGEQRGSNPGAEFTTATEKGATKFYVKFSENEDVDHIWNEQLADNIYRYLDIPVPQTKIVMTEGSYGHASEIIDDINEGDLVNDKLKEGFIADCLLANWDIPYAPHRNTGAANNILYRLDNGGALLFRAQGERKKEDEFNEVVNELGKGSDRQRLKTGSSQEYPGLSTDDIKKQTQHIKEKLTDEAINRLVDQVRLNKKDRDNLKDILKKRRDYIIKQILVE